MSANLRRSMLAAIAQEKGDATLYWEKGRRTVVGQFAKKFYRPRLLCSSQWRIWGKLL